MRKENRAHEKRLEETISHSVATPKYFKPKYCCFRRQCKQRPLLAMIHNDRALFFSLQETQDLVAVSAAGFTAGVVIIGMPPTRLAASFPSRIEDHLDEEGGRTEKSDAACP